MGKTLYDKIWDDHVIETDESGTSLLYIDRHLVHEVTSPQAFEGIITAGRELWRKDSILAVPEHNVPTTSRKSIKTEEQLNEYIKDDISRAQINALTQNVRHFAIKNIPILDTRQGIVHVISPEQGFTQPGITIVCGDSHTSTHGAFGALAFGIGTSEVEHVMATQCLLMKKAKNFRANFESKLKKGVYAKDLILAFIGKIGTAGGTGFTIEFTGSAIKALSMEARMTICNMAIEAGARSGLIGVDEKTIEYIKDTPYFPDHQFQEQACEYWYSLNTDDNAIYDQELIIDADNIAPQVTWGTSPEMVVAVDQKIPKLSDIPSEKRQTVEIALNYMNLQPDQPISSISPNKIFIGSCTNSRIEDLEIAAKIVKGKTLAKNIDQALVVPGSGIIKAKAEKAGLDKIFINAGFEWRESGCSMCLGMNPDILAKGDRCASTSNRNFEGRQGAGSRTHLVSPASAALAAINGKFADTRYI